MASLYKQRPTLRGEGTSNIVLEPVFPIPLENVAPFFLHCCLGLFCRSVDSFKKDLRDIDRRIVDPENRNPVTFEILEGKLEQLTLQLVNTRESVDNSKGRRVCSRNASLILQQFWIQYIPVGDVLMLSKL